MAFRRYGVSVVLCCFLSLTSFGAKRVRSQQTRQDVPKYEDGGTFKITLDVPTEQRAKISGEVDAFIYDHWTVHHRGKLKIIAQTIEGQTTLQSIFIEPDAQGHWRIRDESESEAERGVRPTTPQTRTDMYDEVKRIDTQTGQVVPDSEKRAVGTYTLHLLNKSKGLEVPF